jgi:Na+-transporting methylmalonyl-CoA/oxaloacetate decarboxylase gamma subunit
MEINSGTELSLNIVLHMLILFTFLSLLFFMFISKVEEDAFKKEIGDLLGKTINNVLENNKEQALPVIDQLRPALRYFQTVYSSPDRQTLKQNIMIKFMSVFVGLLLISMFMSITITAMSECKHSVPLGRLILENVIIFAFVGVVEYLFFVNVAMKYIPAPPSLVVKTIIATLREKFN